MKGYIDLYLLPLPKENLPRYRNLATRFGKMAREYGALDYRECIGDDLSPEGVVSFTKKTPLKEDEILISAVVSFKSRAHRDKVMQKMFEDPRMEKMMQEPPVADMKKMSYGGFETFVSV